MQYSALNIKANIKTDYNAYNTLHEIQCQTKMPRVQCMHDCI